MRRLTIMLFTLSLCAAGCKLNLDSKTDPTTGSKSNGNASNGDSSSASSSESSSSSNVSHSGPLWKQALKSRPVGHPEGKPWVELRVDSVERLNTTVLEVTCNEQEEGKICNALDDDCDGHIDEGCGSSTGGIQIAMAWDTNNSMDLSVGHKSWDGTSSGGPVTYWQNMASHEQVPEMPLGQKRDSPMLKNEGDHEGNCFCAGKKIVNQKIVTCGPGCSEKRKTCAPDDPNEYFENVFLEGDKAVPGIYDIRFHNDSNCGTRGAEAGVTLSIALDGELLGSYKSGAIGVQGTSYPILKLYVP